VRHAVGWSSGGGAFTVHAVLWSDGRIIDLGTLPGGLHRVATGINDRGRAPVDITVVSTPWGP
jgi:probable HAF family extracellular repeat protein